MIKRLVSFFIVISLICSTSYITSAADNPQDTIALGKVKFQQMSDNILETNNKISEMNAELNKLNNEINKNNKDIKETTSSIDSQKTVLDELLKEVQTSQDLANKRLRTMYINGYSNNIIGILLTSESFSDFLYKYDAVKRIVSYDKKVFSELIEKKKIINESISKLDLKRKQLQQLKDANAESLKKLTDDKQNLEALIKQFEQEKLSAAQLIKENEEKLIAHSVSVIDSESSTIADVKSALQTLNSLVPQLSTDSVKTKAKDYIYSGNKKLADLIAKAAQTSQPVSSTPDTYKATYDMSATAYSGGTLTAMGLKPVRDPDNLSTIAVDPSVIPLGTKVFIPGYGYAICSDTGGMIKGNIIDLYMNSIADALAWGRRPVTLYIIAYPGEW